MPNDETASGGAALHNPNHSASEDLSRTCVAGQLLRADLYGGARRRVSHVGALEGTGQLLRQRFCPLQFSDSLNASVLDLAHRHDELRGSRAAGRIERPVDASWGWADNGWGVPGGEIFFATSGMHTVRVQQREDGAIVDEIVLSPDTYLSSPPGPRDNDATVLDSTMNSAPAPRRRRHCRRGAAPIWRRGPCRQRLGKHRHVQRRGFRRRLWGTAEASLGSEQP